MHTMVFDKPSAGWLEGLPIGNGRLAAMVWGDEKQDVLSLNHEWLWRGEDRNRKIESGAGHLGLVRQLLQQGDFFTATLAANLFFGGDGGISSKRNRVDPYQPAGALAFTLHGCTGFASRALDIGNAIATAERRTSTGSVLSQYAANCENGLFMCQWSSENGEGFGCDLVLDRVADSKACHAVSCSGNMLTLDCSFSGGIRFRVVSHFQTDGQITGLRNGIRIERATTIRCITNIATDVFNLEKELLDHPARFDSFEQDMELHKARFSEMIHRVRLQLDEDPALDRLPMERRLARVKGGKRDNGLCALYFDFGRYLLLSSSIRGDLPANLQGKWNDRIDPPWECDYHFDINLQMNYRMAEPCGMPQCADTLLRYVESFYESGGECAEKLYGCRGIYLPLQTDAWGISTPESMGWSVWIGAAPWMAQHFWNRYLYSGDLDYLRNRGYRFLKAVAEFYEDYLVEDENGVLQIMPSQSPENRFAGVPLFPVSICVSSAMDVQLACDALGYAVEAAGLLQTDAEQASRWQAMRDRLPGFKIGNDGRLLEWNEEKEECPEELGHRHLSHLYGVFPSALFTVGTRKEQFLAARKAFDHRLAHGGGHTGWSRAWVACLCARFGDGEGVYEHFCALIKDFATVSLLDLHPPRIFQIDGNLGAVMALIESAVSFTDGKIHLLRALPKEWGSGSLTGVNVPGGHVVDVSWQSGVLTEAKICLGYAGRAVVCGKEGLEKEITRQPGELVTIL